MFLHSKKNTRRLIYHIPSHIYDFELKLVVLHELDTVLQLPVILQHRSNDSTPDSQLATGPRYALWLLSLATVARTGVTVGIASHSVLRARKKVPAIHWWLQGSME